MHHVYLIKSALAEVIWVGQTINPKRRLKEHRKTFGAAATMHLIVSDPDDIGQAERHWIAHYRRIGAPLRNIANGGNSRDATADETRAKLSAAGRGKKKPEGFGAKLSAVTKGRPHAWTEHGRARASATHLKGPASWTDPEAVKAKLSAARAKVTPEELARRNSKAWANLTPEQHAARCVAIAKGQRDAGTQSSWATMSEAEAVAARAKISEKLRAAWARRKGA